MSINASEVSELRKLTDCGMMDCKKALQEADGNMEQAVEILRTKGMAKAAKKADRIAAEGIVVVKKSEDGKQAVIVEINSETDFVARDGIFKQFAEQVVEIALKEKVESVDALSQLSVGGDKSIAMVCQELIAKLGENINIRRVAFLTSDTSIGIYVHGGRIGVLVALTGGDEELAKDIAMHIAASKPLVVSPDQVSQERIEKEKTVYLAQAMESGKPADIAEKMVEGRVKKFLNEMSLIGQPFVKNTDETVGQLLKNKQAKVTDFIRFELGDGIEKREENFAEEVMAQVKGE